MQFVNAPGCVKTVVPGAVLHPLAVAPGVVKVPHHRCRIGWPLPANLEQQYTGIKWIYLRRDFQSALYYWRRGELSLKEWYRSIRGRKAYALFSWTDPGPFLADLLRVGGLYLQREEREKRDVRDS